MLTPGGSVAMVASSAHGNKAHGVGPGAAVARLHGVAHPIGGGIWTTKLGGSAAVYVAGGGRVRTVALTAPGFPSTSLRSYLSLVPRRVMRRPAHVIGAASSKVTPARAVPLAVQHGSQQFPFFCGV